MAAPIPGAGRKGGLGWLILAAALAVPGILFYSWWSHMKAQREQSMAAKARGRIPEGGVFQATPNPSKLVNPIASSSSPVTVVEAAEAGTAQAAVTAPPADSIPTAPLAPTKVAAAAAPPALKRDPMISPFDALRLKEEDARRRSAQDQLHKYKRPRGGSVESSIEVLGIISGPGGAPKAIVNNDVVGVGQRIGGVRVVRITDTSVTFEYKGKKFTKSVGP